VHSANTTAKLPIIILLLLLLLLLLLRREQGRRFRMALRWHTCSHSKRTIRTHSAMLTKRSCCRMHNRCWCTSKCNHRNTSNSSNSSNNCCNKCTYSNNSNCNTTNCNKSSNGSSSSSNNNNNNNNTTNNPNNNHNHNQQAHLERPLASSLLGCWLQHSCMIR
jgi:hypothetical protein